jgi:anti-anti-sigma factor
MPLAIDIRPHDRTVLIVLRGDLDLTTAPSLRDDLMQVVNDGARILVDMQAVEFLDSTGLGILVSGRKRARAARWRRRTDLLQPRHTADDRDHRPRPHLRHPPRARRGAERL